MFVTSANTYNDGQWHYGVVTYDGTSTVRLYVDGVQIATKSTTGTPDNTGNLPVRVGANYLTPDRFFIGNVDEVRVWNKALSATEVANAYGGTFASGQVLYLPFSSSATSQKLATAENEIDLTNQTTPLQNFTNITSPSDRNVNNLVPDLPHVPNNTKTLENKVINDANDQKNNNLVPDLPHVPNNTKTLENKVINDANDQKNNRDATINHNNTSLSIPPLYRRKARRLNQRIFLLMPMQERTRSLLKDQK